MKVLHTIQYVSTANPLARVHVQMELIMMGTVTLTVTTATVLVLIQTETASVRQVLIPPNAHTLNTMTAMILMLIYFRHTMT